jgi:hypothetical protein
MHIMRPPSRSRPQPPPTVPTRSSHSSSRPKAVHLVAPILPSYNYYGNHAHKASECSCLFCQVLETETTPITTAKSASIFRCRSTKSQNTLAFHLGFAHQG